MRWLFIMALTVTIAGATKTPMVRSLNISQTLGQRATCDFTVHSKDNTYSPSPGQEVIITDGATKVFGGRVLSSHRKRWGGAGTATNRENQVQCVDFNIIADKRLAGERTYTNTAANDILLDLVTNSLPDEGVDVSLITAGGGPTIERIDLDYPTVAEAFDLVAKLAKYIWWIDYDKKLHFQSPTAPASSFTLGDATGNFLSESLTVNETLEQYANKVVVRLTKYLTDWLYETFDATSSQPPDGSRRIWQMTYQLAVQPTVIVNGITQTTGINGVDTGRQWYWNLNSTEIEQDAAEVALVSTDQLQIGYIGTTTAAVSVQNDAEIAARVAIEGGSGVYERLYESNQEVHAANAQDLAIAILDQVDEASFVADFETDDVAAIVGDRGTINVTGYGSRVYVVRQVQIFDLDGSKLRRRIEAVNGPILQDGYDFFEALTGGASGSAGGAGSAPQLDGDKAVFDAEGTDIAGPDNAWSNHVPIRIAGIAFEATIIQRAFPVAGDVVHRIERSRDNGGSWATVIEITVAYGDTTQLVYTGFADPDLRVGDRLRPVVVSGTARDVNFRIRWEAAPGPAGLIQPQL